MKKLDGADKENIAIIFNESVLEAGPLAKCRFLAGEISKAEYDWYIGHHKYLVELEEKLIEILNKN